MNNTDAIMALIFAQNNKNKRAFNRFHVLNALYTCVRCKCPRHCPDLLGHRSGFCSYLLILNGFIELVKCMA